MTIKLVNELSIQTRLTVSFTSLFGVIILGLAVSSYVLVRNNLLSDLNTELQVAVDATSMSAEHEMNEHQLPAAGEADLQSVLGERSDTGPSEIEILVRQGSRQVAYRRGAGGPVDLRTVPSNRLRGKTVDGSRIASRAVAIKKFDSVYEIYAAASSAPVTNRLQRLALTLALLVPIGLVVAAFAGYAVSRKSLAPLNVLSKTIESITSADLSRRVEVSGGHDEISRIADRFNSLLNRLQAAFAAQQRFMADASHELRTPVTVALAAAQVTTRDPARTLQDADQALRLIEGQMLRVKNLVQQLLLLSQADACALNVQFSAIYLDDVVSEASRAARNLLQIKNQRLEIEPLPEAEISGDSALLVQAIMILVDNAVKYTPLEGTISIGVCRREAHWVCYVSDTGIGIPEAVREQIFDRFYRGNQAAAGREVNGSGLGLAIAKAIVEGHGGTLTLAESRPGFTRFEMGLLALDTHAGVLCEKFSQTALQSEYSLPRGERV